MRATRRVFLERVAATAIVFAGSLKSWSEDGEQELSTSEQIGRETMNTATSQTFEQWIGGTFRVSQGGVKKGTLTLASVTTTTFPRPKDPSGTAPTPETTAQPQPVIEVQSTFLEFTRVGKPLVQEKYTLDHDWLGTFDLLLVFSKAYRGSSICVAVITRMTGRTVLMT